MPERRISVTAEMFRFNSADRSPATNLQLARLTRDFLGKGRLRLCRGMTTGEALSDETANRIDADVLSSLKEIFDLPDSTNRQEFYMRQLKQANRVREYFGELLPEVAQTLEGKNEIIFLSERPSDLIRLLFRLPETIDPTLAHEAQQHVLLSHIAGLINARTSNGRFRTILYDVNNLLNRRIFEGPEGAGHKIYSESFHDDETNRVVGVPHRNDPKPPTAHLKRIPFTVRRIPDLGSVYIGPRKKDDRVAIVKCIANSMADGKKIDVNEYVQDGIGLELVLMEDDAKPNQLTEQVVSAIESGSRKVVDVQFGLTEVGTNRGQGLGFKFDERLKIWFENLTTPLEVSIFTLDNYLNYRLEVGTRDPQTGLYMGNAHELYDLRRARKIAHLLFPDEIYKRNAPESFDLDEAFVKRSKLVAQDLRNRYLT